MLKKTLILSLTLVFLLSACGGQTQNDQSANNAMNDAMANEDMGDDEGMDNNMDENDSMDDSMADDDSMGDEMMEKSFTVRIENISDNEDVLLAPGVFVVHADPAPLFSTGEADRGSGLEALAEDGDPGSLAEALNDYMGVQQVGIFNTPEGSDAPGALAAGNAYVFSFIATPHTYLSFASMFVQSNDLFYAPSEEGIALFNDEGLPITGEITELIFLWDAGTEVNEAPFEGANQAPRQTGPDSGEDEDGAVQLVNGEFSYPDNVIVVTISVE